MKRKNIKSFFGMLLVISLLMSLVACVSNQAATTTGGMIHTTGPKGTEKPTDPSSQPEEPTEPTEPIEPDDGRLSQDELAEKRWRNLLLCAVILLPALTTAVSLWTVMLHFSTQP